MNLLSGYSDAIKLYGNIEYILSDSRCPCQQCCTCASEIEKYEQGTIFFAGSLAPAGVGPGGFHPPHDRGLPAQVETETGRCRWWGGAGVVVAPGGSQRRRANHAASSDRIREAVKVKLHCKFVIYTLGFLRVMFSSLFFGSSVYQLGYTTQLLPGQQVSDLGWVDFDFVYSTVCPNLQGLMRERHNRQSSSARRVEHPK